MSIFLLIKIVTVIGLTYWSFSNFSKKYKKLIILLPLVFIPVWIFTALLDCIINNILKDVYVIFTIEGVKAIVLQMAFTLPLVLIFCGITFSLLFIQLLKRPR